MFKRFFALLVIPYQEIIGNYNDNDLYNVELEVIPYQEIIGNYNCYEEVQ